MQQRSRDYDDRDQEQRRVETQLVGPGALQQRSVVLQDLVSAIDLLLKVGVEYASGVEVGVRSVIELRQCTDAVGRIHIHYALVLSGGDSVCRYGGLEIAVVRVHERQRLDDALIETLMMTASDNRFSTWRRKPSANRGSSIAQAGDIPQCRRSW